MSAGSTDRPGFVWRLAAGSGVAILYAFLLLPILVVAYTSFSPTTASFFPVDHASLRWYRAFLQNESFTSAFRFSLALGVGVAITATAVAFLGAYAIRRGPERTRELGISLALLPLMVPHVLIGLGLLAILSALAYPTAAALFAGQVVICTPFAVAAIMTSLDGVDEQLEQAAMTLGASRWRVLREIVLPLSLPGLVAGGIFAFIVSFGDAYIALFLSGPGYTTLPIEIFAYVQWENTPVLAAITTVQVVLIVVLGVVVERLAGLRNVLRL